jgi:hypothetical protein
MQMKRSFFFAAIFVAGTGAAFAQVLPPPANPSAQGAAPERAVNCAPTRTGPQGSVEPGGTTGERAEPLGDRLAKSGGVLCPPAGVDPEIRAPTPETGNTPVIPPPGSPGGDPSVRPK